MFSVGVYLVAPMGAVYRYHGKAASAVSSFHEHRDSGDLAVCSLLYVTAVGREFFFDSEVADSRVWLVKS